MNVPLLVLGSAALLVAMGAYLTSGRSLGDWIRRFTVAAWPAWAWGAVLLWPRARGVPKDPLPRQAA